MFFLEKQHLGETFNISLNIRYYLKPWPNARNISPKNIQHCGSHCWDSLSNDVGTLLWKTTFVHHRFSKSFSWIVPFTETLLANILCSLIWKQRQGVKGVSGSNIVYQIAVTVAGCSPISRNTFPFIIRTWANELNISLNRPLNILRYVQGRVVKWTELFLTTDQISFTKNFWLRSNTHWTIKWLNKVAGLTNWIFQCELKFSKMFSRMFG